MVLGETDSRKKPEFEYLVTLTKKSTTNEREKKRKTKGIREC